MVTAADAPSIYDIPKVLHREGLDAYVVRRLDLPFRDVDWTVWDDLLRRVHHPKEEVTVALVGKYIDLPDAYLSVGRGAARRRLRPRGEGQHPLDRLRRVRRPRQGAAAHLQRRRRDLRARAASASAASRASSARSPTPAPTASRPSGLCLGLQCMVIEYARTVLGLEKAGSTEFDPDTPEPVIATMAEQVDFVEGAGDLGGTMRLGPLPGRPQGGLGRPGGVRRGADRGAAPAPLRGQQQPTATSSRRPAWSSPAPRRTTTWSSSSSCPARCTPTTSSTQAHPELRSRPTRPHPLFAGLVGAAIERQKELRFPIDESRPAPRRRGRATEPGVARRSTPELPTSEQWPVRRQRATGTTAAAGSCGCASDRIRRPGPPRGRAVPPAGRSSTPAPRSCSPRRRGPGALPVAVPPPRRARRCVELPGRAARRRRRGPARRSRGASWSRRPGSRPPSGRT